MKTHSFVIIATLASALFATWPSLAQSSFWLNNAYAINSPVFETQGNPLQGSNYAAELWGGATADSLTPALSFGTRQRVIVPFLTGSYAGYFQDEQPWDDVTTVLSVPAGDLAWLDVRAWDTRLGATYEQVAALELGGYGESPLFTARGSSPLDMLTPPGALIGLQSFSLLPVVPEPSAFALLVLGGMTVWWAVRRQRDQRP